MATTARPGDGAPLAARVAALMDRARADLAELVSMRSVADPRRYPPEECARAARAVRDAFAELGFAARLIPAAAGGEAEAVIAHRPGPAGAPTVLLYAHYDVQPPHDESAWHSPPFELTERHGRWYGRGAADCKGNIVTLLTALRALGDDIPVGVRVVVEGDEEQGTGGFEHHVADHPDELRADAILVCDTGNVALGVPTVVVSLRGMTRVVVEIATLRGPVHSGTFGGPAPDALAALVHVLASLRDEYGATTVDGLPHDQVWEGEEYDERRFRADAGVLDGVGLTGAAPVSDLLWARPSVTVLGIDCPPVAGASAAVPALARALVTLRVPPGVDARDAREALVAHILSRVPWGARARIERGPVGQPFRAATDGPAYAALRSALETAYGRPVTTAGEGGSVPLCNVLANAFPEAEIALIGVEEPACAIHAPDESVHPLEIERMALAIALFLRRYGGADA
jgi:acetylornithine deacetylase/succinyl-diaminopimelate desuccinylase-like protein